MNKCTDTDTENTVDTESMVAGADAGGKMNYLQSGIEYSLPVWGTARMAADNIRYMNDYTKNTGLTPKYMGRAIGGVSGSLSASRGQAIHSANSISKNLSDIY